MHLDSSGIKSLPGSGVQEWAKNKTCKRKSGNGMYESENMERRIENYQGKVSKK